METDVTKRLNTSKVCQVKRANVSAKGDQGGGGWQERTLPARSDLKTSEIQYLKKRIQQIKSKTLSLLEAHR